LNSGGRPGVLIIQHQFKANQVIGRIPSGLALGIIRPDGAVTQR
jgi:hypothetical protein